MGIDALFSFPLRAAWRLFPPHLGRKLAASMVTALAVPLLDLLSAAAVVVLVLSLQGAGLDDCRLCLLLPFRSSGVEPVVSAVIVFTIATLARHLIEWLYLRYSRAMVQEVGRSLAFRMTEKYLSIPWLEFVSEGRPTRIKNCTGTAMDASSSFIELLNLVRSSASMLILTTGIMVQAPMLGSGILLSLLVSLWLLRQYLQPRLKDAGREQEEAMREYHRSLAHTFDASREVRVYGVQDIFLEAVQAPLIKLSRARGELATLPSIPWLLFDGSISLAIAFTVLGALVVNGGGGQAMLLADLGMIIVVARQVVPSINGVLSAIATLPGKSVSVDIVSRELALPVQRLAYERPNATLPPTAPSLLLMRNVGFAYPARAPILHGVNLDVRLGDRIALLGSSGSGKSSLLMLAAGLIAPTTGEVWVQDPASIAYVPQETVLLDDTILANIVFGLDSVGEELVWRVLTDVHLDSFVRHLPEGLETLAGDNGVRLSGGQRQRLGIARALYRQPKLLLLDEATSALDGQTESIVMDAVVRSSNQRAVVLVTHRIKAAEKAERSFWVTRGRLEAARAES